MVEAVLGVILLGVAVSIYLWTKEYDERIVRLEKRDFERTEAETARQRMSTAEQNLKDTRQAEQFRKMEEQLLEASERYWRTREGVE